MLEDNFMKPHILFTLALATAVSFPLQASAVELTQKDENREELLTLSASCEGESNLPNLIGLDIAVGREEMFERGYRPIINEDFYDSRESKYYPGISELVGCSNGIPWCIFNYENDGNVVILRTLGQQEIVEQEVICDAQKTE